MRRRPGRRDGDCDIRQNIAVGVVAFVAGDAAAVAASTVADVRHARRIGYENRASGRRRQITLVERRPFRSRNVEATNFQIGTQSLRSFVRKQNLAPIRARRRPVATAAAAIAGARRSPLFADAAAVVAVRFLMSEFFNKKKTKSKFFLTFLFFNSFRVDFLFAGEIYTFSRRKIAKLIFGF